MRRQGGLQFIPEKHAVLWGGPSWFSAPAFVSRGGEG